MRSCLLLAVILTVACGSTAGSGSSTGPVHTFTATAPSASPTPSVSPSPSPTAIISAKGSIGVREPRPNERTTTPVIISGDASVFEANLEWRITDSAGRVLANGNTTATAGAPARGTFTIVAAFPRPGSDTIAIVEVFDRIPRDGSVDEIVRVPIVVTP